MNVKSIFDCRLSSVHKANQMHDILDLWAYVYFDINYAFI